MIFGFFLFLLSQVQGEEKQPNVIFILADDLGWNDVSWNNPDMPTHHMEKLAQVIVPGSIHPQGEALIHFLVFILDHKITLVMTENTNQMVLLSMTSDLMKI